MATTGYARTMAGAPVVQPARPDRPATGDDWEVLAIHQADPPTSQPWWLGVYCTAETDPGTTGQLRLRSAQAVSTPAVVAAQRDVYYTNFPTAGTHSVLGAEWERYNATPGNGGFGVRSDSQIEVVAEGTAVDGANVLRLTAENVGGAHYHGGVKLKLPQVYGEYEFRMRTTADATEVTSGLAILWPRSDLWPRDGEIDLVESFGNRDTRTPLEFYTHRLNPAATLPYDAADDQFQGRNHVDPYTGDPLDGTDWHKFVFRWTPDRITVQIDNHPDERVLIDDPAWIPDWPMELTFQLDAWSDTPPATPVTMDVDYVVVRTLSGEWSVDGSRILDRAGREFIATGLNGGALISTPGVFSGPAGSYVAWAYDRYPGNFVFYTDPWPGDSNVNPAGAEVFPGGLITGGKYWSQGSNGGSGAFVDIPDRTYALDGNLTQTAASLGIEAPADHWHARIFRINAHLVSGANTWSGVTLTAADTIPQYVARVLDLLRDDPDMVVAIEDHDMTGTDPVMPSGLVSNPMLASSSVAAGPIRDALDFYDALANAFQGASANVWIGLPNEAYTTGRATNLTNDATLTTNYDDFIFVFVSRLRGKGYDGVITLPMGRWAGELGPLSRGSYDTLIDRLATANIDYNLVWEWHNYGSDYPAGVGPAAVEYTYTSALNQLAACRSAGLAVWMAEYGRPVPMPADLPENELERRTITGVDMIATTNLGPPLGLLFPGICPTYWSTADNSFVSRYALTRGAANKADEDAADPNSTGAQPGTYPWWDVTTEALADEWLTSGGRAHWDLGHAIWGDQDSSSLGISPAITVSGHTRNVRLGFEQIPLASQRVFIEGRRLAGTGALRLHRTAGSLVSAPPVSLRTSPSSSGSGGAGGGGGGGGGGTPVVPSSVRSTWQSVGQSTSHTVTPASFDPPAQAGDKIVFIAAAAGVTEVPSLTLTLPGSPLVPKTAGTGFNPQVACTVTDYNASGWTLTGSFAFRAVAICLRDTVSVAASAASEGSSPLNPASVAHGANALGMAVNVLNYTGASVLTPATTPAAHEVVLATPIDIRQIHVASVDISAAGTYDPGAATIGPGTESSVSFSLAAWPASSTTAPAAPTQPAWDPTGATTLNASDNVASIVAAAAPGAKFILQAVTYTNWNDVRYKTGMHFRIPNSGTVTLEGTGFTWAGRAIDATGSSDNVLFTSGGGRLVVQNYGNGTARQEYGAFQAGPMDTGPGSSDYTYGVAQGWQLWNVDFIKNSAGGYRCSDYTVVSDCGFWGHTVSGISYEMATGGRFHNVDFDANGLNPASGVYANGAGCKLTWSNATGIRNAILASGIRRAKAPLIFTDCSWSPTHAGVTGSGRIALWLDLDCQQVQIWNPTIGAHADAGLIIEGSNGVTIDGGSIDNCDGYGAANGENFIAGALTIGEAQNVVVDGLAISNSVRAIVIRQSGRADWNGPISSNVAYTTKGWLTAAQEPRPGLLDQASQWTSNITIRNHVLTNCDRVILSEGANAGGMSVVGSLPVATIVFEGGDYSGSTNLVNATSGGGFFDRSNSGVTLTAWQAKPEQRDQ